MTLIVRPLTPPTPVALSVGACRVWLGEVVAAWGSGGVVVVRVLGGRAG